MPGCSVASCHNWNGKTRNQHIKYFQFPKDDTIRQKWIDACNSDKKINLQNGRVCSCHFESDCFLDTSYLSILSEYPILKLRSDAIPTLHLTADTTSPCKKKRVRKRKSDDEEEKGSMLKRMARSSNTSTTDVDKSNFSLNILNKENLNTNTFTSSSIPGSSCTNHHENISSSNIINQGSENIHMDNAASDQHETSNNLNQSLLAEMRQLKLKNEELKARLQLKEIEIREHCQSVQTQIKNKVYEILSPIFTPGQIRKLLHPKQKTVKWSNEDIASAIALRSVSPEGYRYLCKKGYPLPGLSTLSKISVL